MISFIYSTLIFGDSLPIRWNGKMVSMMKSDGMVRWNEPFFFFFFLLDGVINIFFFFFWLELINFFF